jgi:hypothetical protein
LAKGEKLESLKKEAPLWLASGYNFNIKGRVNARGNKISI